MDTWRVEDIKYSPDKLYIIMPDYRNNVIHIGNEHNIELFTISSNSFLHPHGVVFIDSNHFCVTNRAPKGNVSIYNFTEPFNNIEPLSSKEESMASGIVKDNNNLLVVCNDNRVLKYSYSNYQLSNAELLIKSNLNLPDGIAITNDSKIIAISNHNTGEVLLYHNDEKLGPETPPFLFLKGQIVPHGLCFSDKYLIVTDAGSRYVFVYEIGTSTRYIVDVVSHFIQENIEEGGMKGIDIRDNDVIMSYDRHPYNKFKLDDLIKNPDFCPREELKRLQDKFKNNMRYLRSWVW